MRESILNVNIRCFKNCSGTEPREVRLLNWLTNEQYRDKVLELRQIQDEELQKVIKRSLPAITPSGLFTYRSEKDLISHSGFLAFDIDFSDNTHLDNFDELREQISHITNVAYCGLSVRGRGFWGLVPVPKSTPEVHKQRFAALSRDFKTFGINLDRSGSDITRLRIYSWDDKAYFNHSAKLYTKLPSSRPRLSARPARGDTRDRVENILSRIKEGGIDITGDYKEGWLKIAMALFSEFGESGRGYFHTVSMFHPSYNVRDTDKTFDSVSRHNYNKVTIASFFKIASDYGVTLSREPVPPDANFEDIVMRPRELHSRQDKKEDREPWDMRDITEFFTSTPLPSGPVYLKPGETITDVSLFVESYLSCVTAQNGNKRYLPYLEKLRELKILLSKN